MPRSHCQARAVIPYAVAWGLLSCWVARWVRGRLVQFTENPATQQPQCATAHGITPRPPPFADCMKRLAFALFALFIASAAIADEPAKPAEKPAPSLGPRAEKLIKEALPICSQPVTESRVALQHQLPGNIIGTVVRIESKQSAREGHCVAI